VISAAEPVVVAVSTPISAAKPKGLKAVPAAPTEEEESLAQATDVQPKDVPEKGITYLKNTERFKMAFFKGKTYDQIRPIFQARFDANMRFLLKSKEEMKKEEEDIIKSINETPAQKAEKRRILREQAKEAKDLKKQLEVVADEDDDV
nr:hypothetical protein [Tanacetum cinerariifolium]